MNSIPYRIELEDTMIDYLDHCFSVFEINKATRVVLKFHSEKSTTEGRRRMQEIASKHGLKIKDNFD